MTYILPIAPRLRNLPNYPFAVLGQRIQQLRAEGKSIIRLDMGSPDLPPSSAVIEALAESASRPDTHGYSGYTGTPEFRKAVANYYQKRFGVTVDPNTEVLPLIGSKEGIVNMMMAAVGPGDVVLVPSLAYPAYAMGAKLAEAEVVEMPTRHENKYLPVFEDISLEDRTRARMLWLNYPNNPTGAFCTREFYGEAVEFCRQHDIMLCSDNPYLEVVFDGRSHAPSALEAPNAKDVTVEFISMSKSHNMAGWRLGAAVGNKEAIASLLVVKSNLDSGHFKAIYDAGVVALETTPQGWIDSRNARYAGRRDRIIEVLPQIGLAIDEPPEGSLYVWARVQDGDDINYTDRALNETGVSITPGSIYGNDGHGYVRISLGISEAELEDALQRLIKWWNS
jgi:LL-diaminopimelate aminotransferase